MLLSPKTIPATGSAISLQYDFQVRTAQNFLPAHVTSERHTRCGANGPPARPVPGMRGCERAPTKFHRLIIVSNKKCIFHGRGRRITRDDCLPGLISAPSWRTAPQAPGVRSAMAISDDNRGEDRAGAARVIHTGKGEEVSFVERLAPSHLLGTSCARSGFQRHHQSERADWVTLTVSGKTGRDQRALLEPKVPEPWSLCQNVQVKAWTC
jgi:hypothetical protein